MSPFLASPARTPARIGFAGRRTGAGRGRAERVHALARTVLELGPLGRQGSLGRIAGAALGVLLAAALPDNDGYLLWNLGAAGALGLVGRLARRAAAPRDAEAPALGVLIGALLSLAWIEGPSPLAVVVAFCLYVCVDTFRPWPLAVSLGLGGPLVRDATTGGLVGLALLALRFALHSPAAWTGGAA